MEAARRIEPACVLERFCLLANCDADEAQRWAAAAVGCAARLEARLRDEVDVEANTDALAMAAAGMLFYQYTMANAAGDGDVRLGEITATNGAAGVEHARSLRDELLCGVGHLLKSGGTFLLQVRTEGCE